MSEKVEIKSVSQQSSGDVLITLQSSKAKALLQLSGDGQGVHLYHETKDPAGREHYLRVPDDRAALQVMHALMVGMLRSSGALG